VLQQTPTVAPTPPTPPVQRIEVPEIDVQVPEVDVQVPDIVVHSGSPAPELIQALVTDIVGMVLLAITIMVIGVPLVRALARRWDRQAVVPKMPAELGDRLDRIEQAIETMAIEVERISEAQRFSAKLLADHFERPKLGVAASARADER
jgi:hypothetical protein